MSDFIGRRGGATRFKIFEAPGQVVLVPSKDGEWYPYRRAEVERLQGRTEGQRKHIKEIERCRREERAESRNRIEQLQQAVGLLTTLHPTMEMDVERPLEMAQKIERHVTEEKADDQKMANSIIREHSERIEELKARNRELVKENKLHKRTLELHSDGWGPMDASAKIAEQEKRIKELEDERRTSVSGS